MLSADLLPGSQELALRDAHVVTNTFTPFQNEAAFNVELPALARTLGEIALDTSAVVYGGAWDGIDTYVHSDAGAEVLTYQGNSATAGLVFDLSDAVMTTEVEPPAYSAFSSTDSEFRASSFSLASAGDPILPAAGELVAGIDQFLSTLQNSVDALFAQDLPFVGTNFDTSELFSDIRNELHNAAGLIGAGALEALDDALTSAFSSFGALKDTGVAGNQADDVRVFYALDDGVLREYFSGDTVDVTLISQIEAELTIGDTYTFPQPIDFDFGLPGLELEIIDGSQIVGVIDWGLNLAFGYDANGFYVVTDHANELSMTIGASVNDEFQLHGRLGILEVVFSEIDGNEQQTGFSGTAGIDLVANSDGVRKLYQADFGDITNGAAPTLTLSAKSDLRAMLGFAFEQLGDGTYLEISEFPTLSSDFVLEWNIAPFSAFSIAASDVPIVGFKNLKVDLGQFVDKFLGAVMEPVNDFLEPVRPLLEFLDGEVPLISHFSELAGQGEFTFLDLLARTGDNAQLVNFLESLKLVDQLAQIAGAGGEGGIPLGDMMFGGKDLRLPRGFSEAALPIITSLSDPNLQQLLGQFLSIDEVKSALGGLGPAGVKIANALNSAAALQSEDSKISFPLIDDPASIVGMMFGQHVDLVKARLKPLVYDKPIELEYGLSLNLPDPLPDLGIFLFLRGKFHVEAHLAFGYDTYGLWQFLQTGDVSQLLEGAYISDDPSETGGDPPELTIDADIFLGAETDVIAASVAVSGGLVANITADLVDIPDAQGQVDGKIRPSEILEQGLDVVNLAGWLALEAKTEGGAAGSGPYTLDEIAHQVLFQYPSEALGLADGIASFDTSSNTLYLNMGDRANLRQVFADQVNEDYRVRMTAKGGVEVSAFGRSAVIGESGPRVERIVARGGDGNDRVTIIGDFAYIGRAPVVFDLDGGDGNDFMQSGAGADILTGGAGSDTLDSGKNNDQLYGFSRTSQGTNLADHDVLRGGAGDDVILGSLGADYIDAGDGQGIVYAGDGDDVIVAGNLRGSYLGGGAGNDTIFGGDRADTIGGGAGNDLIIGGANGDTIDSALGLSVSPFFAPVFNGGAASASDRDIVFADFLDINSAAQAGIGADLRARLSGLDPALFDHDGLTVSGVNFVTTGDGNDAVFGGDGRDVISVFAGNDTVYGGDGDNVINALSGNKLIVGGNDQDYVTVSGSGGGSVSGNGGDDIMSVGGGGKIVTGGEGNDYIGVGFDNQAFGEAGDDTLAGGDGNVTLIGAGGRDQISGGAFHDLIFGGDDNDIITDHGGNDTISGDDGDDQISADGGDDLIHGEAGNDTIAGGEGNDTVYAGTEDDSVDSGGGDDRIDGEAGNDTIAGGAGRDLVFGAVGDDSLSGGAGSDLVFGELGSDTIDGGEADDAVDGGEGDDLVRGGGGNDIVQGQAGDDELLGDAGDDRIEGSTGRDTLRGGDGSDYLSVAGGLGDLFFGDGGDDEIHGSAEGGPTDPDFFDAIAFGDMIFGGEGRDLIFGYGGADRILGDGGDDTISGGDDQDLILGGAGDDSIEGGLADDIIYGGIGADAVLGQAGNDLIFGRDGGQTIVFDGVAGLTIAGTAPETGNEIDSDTLKGGLGNDTVSGEGAADNIDGGFGVDLLSGGSGDDVVDGGGGVGDNIFGNSGADILLGSDDGADLIEGGAGDDRIQGRGGGDTLRGDADNDVIDGGAGDDLIEGGAGRDLLVGGANHDLIFGHSVSDAGDDNAPDILFGDFGTNGNEAGSGADQLFGQGGNDHLFGEAGIDRLDATAGDTFLAAEAADSANYVLPPQTPEPTPIVPPSIDPQAVASLPSDPFDAGWWGPLAGPAGNSLASGATAAVEPSVTADASGTYVAWADGRDGDYSIYVARRTGDAWTELAGSAHGDGISGGAAGRRPVIAMLDGQPVVAWTSINQDGTTSIRLARFDPAANGGAGGWIALATSLAAGGISGFGQFDQVRLLDTVEGLVVTWRALAGSVAHVFAKRFNGTAWVDLTPESATGEGISGPVGVVDDYAVATDGTRIAVAWSAETEFGNRLQVRELRAGAWVDVFAPDNIKTNEFRSAERPSLAYFDGNLFAAWVERDRNTEMKPQVYVRQLIADGWVEAGPGAATGAGLSLAETGATMPKLVASGGGLRVVWSNLENGAEGPAASLYTASWDGSAFVPDLPTDRTGTGVGHFEGWPDGLSVAIDENGRAFVAASLEGSADAGMFVRAGGTGAANVFIADATTSLQSILNSGTLQAGDLIVIAGPTSDGDITIGAGASGVTISGAGGLVFGHNISIDGAENVTIRNLTVSGTVAVGNSSGVALIDNIFLGSVTVSGADQAVIRDNIFRNATLGLALTGPSIGEIVGNRIENTGTGGIGLRIAADFDGSIFNNRISGRGLGTGLSYEAAATLSGNRIEHQLVGVKATVADPARAFGFVAGSGANVISQNATGVSLVGGAMRGQQIDNNQTGVSGSGVLGASGGLAQANVIAHNGTGVAQFTGDIIGNVISRNGIGVDATNKQGVLENVIDLSDIADIRVSGARDVRIAGNTIRAQAGDGVHLTGGALNVDIVSNIISSESGYAIFVHNDSQVGYWSDYNTLHAGDGGKLYFWTKDFTDILDFQVEVAQYDLHSFGRTVINPGWAGPRVIYDGADTMLLQQVAGQRLSDPAADGGDPAGAFVGYRGVPNLLANASFESGLAGWATTAGVTATSATAAYWGSTVLAANSPTNASAVQSIDLLAAGFTAAQLDSNSLVASFGARVRLLNAASEGQVSIAFRDVNGDLIGSSHSVSTSGETGRYIRLFETVRVPAGARSVEFVLSANQTGGANVAYFDGTFLGVVPRGFSITQGAGELLPATPAPDGRLALRSPDLYMDAELHKSYEILWDSFGAASGQPVRIELWQDGPNGPAFRQLIVASAPDTGRYIWTPDQVGLDFGTYDLRVKILRVDAPHVFDMSTETFSVPEDGNTYWIDDHSNAGDEFSTAIGDNRNTGKLSTAPKFDPASVFRIYDVGAGSTVKIDAGEYPLIHALTLSGSLDRGLGLDEGFTLTGPTDVSKIVHMFPANPLAKPEALLDIFDADFVTLRNLSLSDAVRGLWVYGGSDNFAASYISATGHSGDAIWIETNSPGAVFDHLTASNSGGAGIVFKGAATGLTHLSSVGNHDGLLADGNIGRITDSTFSHNTMFGMGVGATNAVLIEANVISDNRTGASIFGPGAIFGNSDLSLGRGNKVSGNIEVGVRTIGDVTVVGNTIYGTRLQGLYDEDGWYRRADEAIESVGLLMESFDAFTFGQAHNNLISYAAYGLQYRGGNAQGTNRITGNRISLAFMGMQVSALNVGVSGNVILDSNVGVELAGGGTIFKNNIITGSRLASVHVFALGGGVRIENNTFVEDKIGETLVPPKPDKPAAHMDSREYGFAVGSVVFKDSANGQVFNNIISVTHPYGIGLRPSLTSQIGFVSDYNYFHTEWDDEAAPDNVVALWQGVPQITLDALRSASSHDANSRFSAAPIAFSDGNFHLPSVHGSFHGGSLAVVENPVTGLPVLSAGTLTADAFNSPGIDRGNPATPIGNEPAPNGGIVEIGAYGGTSQASLSPASFILVNMPDGGEFLPQNRTSTVSWHSFNVNETVDISVSSDGVNFVTIADDVANTGSFAWTIDPLVFPVGTTYRLKVAASSGAVSDVSNSAFAITPEIKIYYINDGNLVGDQYTSAIGLGTNSGTSAGSPLDSLQTLLSLYTLGPGDIVKIDAGTYNITQNIVFAQSDSGTGDAPAQRLLILGATGGGTVFNRGSETTGFRTFEFTGADFVTIRNVTFQGGDRGVSLNDNAQSLGITVENSRFENRTGIYVGTGNHDFSLIGSALVRVGSNSNTTGLQISNADRADVINSHFENWGTAVSITNGTGNSVRNSTFLANNNGLGVVLAAGRDFVIEGLNISGYLSGISSTGTGVIRDNIVTLNKTPSSTGISGISVNSAFTDGGALVSGNTVSGFKDTFGQSIGISGRGRTDVVRDNVSFGNDIGIRAGDALVEGNRAYGNLQAGILFASSNSALGVVTGNKVYNNAVGIRTDLSISDTTSATLSGNYVFDNTVGIRLNNSIGQFGKFEVSNNTILQTGGAAIELVQTSSGTTIRNNIISLVGAVGISVGNQSQQRFASNYNLFDLQGGSSAGIWNGRTFGTLADWRLELGFDRASVLGNPDFADPDGADDVRGAVGGVDRGADDDFRVQPTSVAIDRGDPASLYLREPSGNGARINIGAEGNTPGAAASPGQMIQLLNSLGGERYIAGQSATVNWRSAGLVALDPVVSIDSRFLISGQTASNIVGEETWIIDRYRTGGTNSSTGFSMDLNGLNVPTDVMLTSAVTASGEAQISYDIPVSDGRYQVTLFFAEYFTPGPNDRLMDIVINGTTVRTNYSIITAAGAANRATSLTFVVDAENEQGLAIDLIKRAGVASIAGLQIKRVNDVPQPWTAALDVSLDNGATWTSVATGLALDNLGRGSFNWTPPESTQGFTGLFRVTATDGSDTVIDRSISPFFVAPATNVYYVDDGSNTGDVYTPNAVGDNANSGLTPDAPMASLQALLNAYDLLPGAIVYVDSGTYNLPTEIVFNADDSGTESSRIQVVGPGGTATATFQRGNTAAGTAVIRFNGADNVTLSGLKLVGGEAGVELVDRSFSQNIRLTGLDISGWGNTSSNFLMAGVRTYSTSSSTGNDGLIVENSFFHDAAVTTNVYGIGIRDTNATISGNTITGLWQGIRGGTTVDNNLLTNNRVGIEFSGTVSNNTISNSSSTAISQVASALNNTITGLQVLNSVGISVFGGTASGNDVSGYDKGISVGTGGGTVSGNRVHDNRSIGIDGAATIRDNEIFNNVIGVQFLNSSIGTIQNNLIYGNTQHAIFLRNSGTFGTQVITNNTIHHVGGAAIRAQALPTSVFITATNNIVQVDGAAGRIFDIDAASQPRFSSDYNLYWMTGGASFAQWETRTVGPFLDWRFNSGFDQHSINADPLFVNASTRDYHLQAGSLGIDAGDPASAFATEPGPNGGRINLGHDGNRATATQSAAQVVQVLSPNGWDKFEIGLAVTITFRANGFAAGTTADVEVSYDEGDSWQFVAAGVALNGQGLGSASWTPGAVTAGNTALVRVTVGDVSDVSDSPFLVANAGRTFYVDDASDTGDEYTPDATGDDRNSGKSPDKPMASLAALLRAYDLNPGDIVYVDTGSYFALTDIVFGAQDSGAQGSPVLILGPSDPLHVAVIDRGNVVARDSFIPATAVMRFNGADDVSIVGIDMMRADAGVAFTLNSGSDRVSIANSEISNVITNGVFLEAGNQGFVLDHSRVFAGLGTSTRTGLDFKSAATVTNSEVFGFDYGIRFNSTGSTAGLVDNSSVHDNSTKGIWAQSSYPVTISNNRVFQNGGAPANRGTGIEINSLALAIGNEVFNQVGTDNVGITAGLNARAQSNIVYGNSTGILMSSGLVSGNRVFANTTFGVEGGGTLTGNRIYSNPTGVRWRGGTLDQNLIYANANIGIDVWIASASTIAGNTIYQSVGTGVSVTSSSRDINLANNIIAGDAGSLLLVASDSLTGLQVDYNLYYRGSSGAANIASVAGITYADLAAFKTGRPTLNLHSLEGNPLFIDINGADNILGGPDVTLGGGADDNFGMRPGSLAIDAANSLVLKHVDHYNLPRHNDPSTPDTGSGFAFYGETGSGPSNIAENPPGTVIGPTGASTLTTVNLPFSFNFFGTAVTSVRVSAAGFIVLDPAFFVNEPQALSPSVDMLAASRMIAPFWGPLRTANTPFVPTDRMVVDSQADRVTIRWITRGITGVAQPANFSATLFQDGSIRFDYGAGLDIYTPVIGVSAGGNRSFTVASISGQGNLSNTSSLTFTPDANGGLDFYDIGAIEFQGDSSDVTPPVVTAIPVLPADGGSTDRVFNQIAIHFSEALDYASARSAANFALVEAGTDGAFDTEDDQVVAVKPNYSFPSGQVILSLPGTALADGTYRLTVSGTNALRDTAGLALDGDENGVAGGDFVTTFTIDRSQNQAPDATGASVVTAEGEPVTIQLDATDPDGHPLTYSIVGQPQFGTIESFDPVAGTFVYRPVAGYSGLDTLRFRVSDDRLGQDEADIAITVTPVNQAPVADPLNVSAIAGQGKVIVLTGRDAETPGDQLVFVITSQPQHGTLFPLSENTVRYVANPGYSGPDSFAYAWRDTGDPAGTPGNALVGTSATVSITVVNLNVAPTAVANSFTVNQDQSLTITSSALTANDTDSNGDPLTVIDAFDAVNGSVALDPVTGKVTFTPNADHVGAASFSYTIADPAGATSTAIVSINVLRVNRAPQSEVDSYVVAADATLTIVAGAGVLANDSDPNFDALSAILVVDAANGTLSLAADGSFVYTPDVGFLGTDTFTYRATDGSLSGTATIVSIEVGVNATPTPSDDVFTGDEDAPLTLSAGELLANDTDPDGMALTVDSVSNAFGGTVSLEGDTVVFVPDANAFGDFGFDYTVRDALGGTATAHVVVQILPVNDAPTPGSDVVVAHYYGDYYFISDLLLNDLDVDGDALFVTGVLNALHGMIYYDSENGYILYQPDDGYEGMDVFTYTVSDGTESRSAEVRVEVRPFNRPPESSTPFYTMQEDGTLAVTIEDLMSYASDADGNPVTFLGAVSGYNGSAVLDVAGGVINFKPRANFNGYAYLSYMITDGIDVSWADAIFQVDPMNDNPVGRPDVFLRLASGGSQFINGSELLFNDGDVDGDWLTIVSVSQPTHGSLTFYSGAQLLEFDPEGFVGRTVFTYDVTDGTTTRTVTVTIHTVPDSQPPVAIADKLEGLVGEDVTLPVDFLTQNDLDYVNFGLTVEAVNSAVGCTVVLNDDGTFTYRLNAGFTGLASFKYVVSDGENQATGIARISEFVVENQPPVVRNNVPSVLEDRVLVLDEARLLANDFDRDGDTLHIVAVDQAVNGSVTWNQATGEIRFTPPANYYGPASFRYVVSDGTHEVAGQVIITVKPADDRPTVPRREFDTGTNQPLVISWADLIAGIVDPEGEQIAFGFARPPVANSGNGSVSIDVLAQTVTFTPATDFVGTAGFVLQYFSGGRSLATPVYIQVGALGGGFAAEEAAPADATWSRLAARGSLGDEAPVDLFGIDAVPVRFAALSLGETAPSELRAVPDAAAGSPNVLGPLHAGDMIDLSLLGAGLSIQHRVRPSRRPAGPDWHSPFWDAAGEDDEWLPAGAEDGQDDPFLAPDDACIYLVAKRPEAAPPSRSAFRPPVLG